MLTLCVVTATRAEYGLLRPLLSDIIDDPDLELQIISTGSHLSDEFGYTNQEIIDDGFLVNKKIEILLSSDTPVGVSKSMGLALISFSEVFHDLMPDIVVVLGDRYELLPIVTAANFARIPVAHLSGGEKTEGSLDELIRHAVTKLSQLHFTATETYANRVIQMGEQPGTVFNIGEVGLDNIYRMNLMAKHQVEHFIGTKLKQKNLLFSFHPETTKSPKEIENDVRQILSAIDKIDNCLTIFTKSNADVGGRLINKIIEGYVKQNRNKSVLFTSMGHLRYLSAMQYVDVVIGNSSSGIVEAPSLKIPTINIGLRQKGRIRAKSIIDVGPINDEIVEALKLAFSDEFRCLLVDIKNPYGSGESSKKFIKIIKSIDIKDLKIKKFYDIKFQK